MEMLVLEVYWGSVGLGRHSASPPLSLLGVLLQNPTRVSVFSVLTGPPHFPKIPQSWSWAVSSPCPPATPPLTFPFLFPCFLSTPEEDPCACESIVKFQTRVEGLLQALTRKHILSQRPLRDGGSGRVRGREREAPP